MKIYVRGINKETEIFLYKADNRECTQEFIEKNFLGNGLEQLSAEEKENCSDDCKYAISRHSYNYLIERLDELQKIIDEAAEDIDEDRENADISLEFGRKIGVM